MTSATSARAKCSAIAIVVALTATTLLITTAAPAPAEPPQPAASAASATPAESRPAPDRTIRPAPEDASGREPSFASSGEVFADPDVVRLDFDLTSSSTYRMYSTNICGWGCITVPTMTTSNFGTYTTITDAMPNGIGSWASPGYTWAPDVHRFGSQWVLFYTARVRGTANTQCIGRAIASSAAGPFVDSRSTPFVCTNAPSGAGAGGAIDASVHVSDDGTPYLLWKNDGNNPTTCGCGSTIWSRQLTADGSTFVGSPRSLISNGGDYTVEAPQFVPAESGLWLLYSAGYYGGPDYRTDVGWCAGPLGPCHRSGPNLVRSGGGLVAPGGAGTVTDRVGRTWMAYHSGTVNPDLRRLQIDALRIDPGGPRRILEPISVHDPWGGVDAAYAVPGGLTITGWAIDPNGNETTDVQVSVLNSAGAPILKAVVSADLSHGGTAAVLGPSTDHGFSATVTTLAMARTVCLRAVNRGPGASNPQFACRTVQVLSGAPFGSLDVVARAPAPGSGLGTITVSGWAIDPDTTGPVDVHIWSGGKLVSTPSAVNPRGDIGAAFPGYGPNHGFTATFSVPPGTQEVCVYLINTGPGSANPRLACQTPPVPSGNPYGVLDMVQATPGSVTVSGWAIDPDTTGPVDVHIWSAGQLLGTASAANPRGDIAAAYPAYGPNHGFSATFGAPPGTQEVCVYLINTGPGNSNPRLPCRTVTVASGNPYGVLDMVQAGPGSVTVSGWAIDPDTTGPVDVHIWSAGQLLGTASAANPRGDIAAAYPAYGPNHGFSATFSAPPGTQEVCVYLINTGPGNANPRLPCRTVTVT